MITFQRFGKVCVRQPLAIIFGPSLTFAGGIPDFGAPNSVAWTALGPASLTEGGNASGRMSEIAADINLTICWGATCTEGLLNSVSVS